MSISLANRETPLSGARRRPMLPFYAAAAVDLLIGVDLALFGPAVAAWLLPGQQQLLGMTTGAVFRGLGVVLVLFALDTVWLARSSGALRRFLPAVVGASWAWVVALAVALAAGHAYFSPTGTAALGILALLVAAVAILQARAIKNTV